MMRWYVLLVMMAACSSCSFVALRNDLSVADASSGWREVAAGPVDDRFEYVADGDTISVGYFDLGSPVLIGPPYLPLIPTFIFAPLAPKMPYYAAFDAFRMNVGLGLSDSVDVSEQRLRFNSEGAAIESSTGDSWRPIMLHPTLYCSVYEHITQLDTFDVVFDSIVSQSRAYDVPPLKLRRGKSLTFYNKDFGHAGSVW